MKSTAPPSRLPRQAVLIVSHPDGYVEVFADANIDVYLARVPVAETCAGERLADECLALMLPRRYRDLHRADRLRTVGTTRPLRPKAAHAAILAGSAISALNALDGEREEVVRWAI